MTNVLEKDVQSLQELHTHITARLLTQNVQKEHKHVLLQEKARTTLKVVTDLFAVCYMKEINQSLKRLLQNISAAVTREQVLFKTVGSLLVLNHGHWVKALFSTYSFFLMGKISKDLKIGSMLYYGLETGGHQVITGTGNWSLAPGDDIWYN